MFTENLKNRSKHRQQKHFCSKLYERERRKFYLNLKLSDINDNKTLKKRGESSIKI